MDFNRSTLSEDFLCCSHRLNLIATSDFKNILEPCRASSFKLNHEKAFGKLQKLWNVSNRSVRASEIIFDTVADQIRVRENQHDNAEVKNKIKEKGRRWAEKEERPVAVFRSVCRSAAFSSLSLSFFAQENKPVSGP